MSLKEIVIKSIKAIETRVLIKRAIIPPHNLGLGGKPCPRIGQWGKVDSITNSNPESRTARVLVRCGFCNTAMSTSVQY